VTRYASGTTPRVWAPAAASVELEMGESRIPMARDARGWWTAPTVLPPSTSYGFVVDGDGPFPDPRSPSQPRGIHGPSRTVDHGEFRWTDEDWTAPPLREGVVYELHVGTFTPEGTFDAAIGRLRDLVDLGVTHLELMPVAEFSGGRGWGYDGVDLYAPHHAYGGPDGLKRLVDAAHASGLGVLLDVVYNHLGPEGNYLGRFGPYFSAKYVTPWGDAVNFDDRGSDEVRRFVVDNAVMWLRDYHFDGLRLDAVHAIVDMSATHLLEEIAEATHALEAETGRSLVITVESDLNDPRLLRPVATGGYGVDAAWADDVHHALHVALTGESSGYYADFTEADALERVLTDPYLYDGRYSPFRDRRHGRRAGDLAGDRFIAAIQNHDQIGNRALGERLSQLVTPERARIGAALLLTSPYVPLLFAGEEWGASTRFQYFTGHESPELADAVRTGRRREFAAFGWDPETVPDPQDPATFDASKLDWDERSRDPHATTLAWYRDLIALRRSTPALMDADRAAVRVTHDHETGSLTVARGPVTLVANLGSAPVQAPLEGTVRLASPPGTVVRDGVVELPPDGAVVAERGR
jgi:maltooligosyltrehalose trehalohydrolase